MWKLLSRDYLWTFLTSQGLKLTFHSFKTFRDYFWQFLKVQGLVLPNVKLQGLKMTIWYILHVFHLFLVFLFISHIKTHFNEICNILWSFVCFWSFLWVQMVTKWWVFAYSSIPHTKLLLVPSNLLLKRISLPKVFTSGVAKCFGSSKNFGTMITKWFLANHQLSTDSRGLYQKPFASGLVNPYVG